MLNAEIKARLYEAFPKGFVNHRRFSKGDQNEQRETD